MITAPSDGATAQGPALRIEGYAMSGGRSIIRVDVSTDGGETWHTATITRSNDRWTWIFWELKINLQPGEYSLAARAFDTSSNSQPESPQHIWNFKGYMNNSWHRIDIKVR